MRSVAATARVRPRVRPRGATPRLCASPLHEACFANKARGGLPAAEAGSGPSARAAEMGLFVTHARRR